MSFLLFHCLSFNASKFLFSFPFLYLCSNYVWITRKHRSLSDGQFFLSLLLLVLQIKYFSFSCFGFLILDVSSTSLQESIRHFSLSLLCYSYLLLYELKDNLRHHPRFPLISSAYNRFSLCLIVNHAELGIDHLLLVIVHVLINHLFKLGPVLIILVFIFFIIKIVQLRMNCSWFKILFFLVIFIYLFKSYVESEDQLIIVYHLWILSSLESIYQIWKAINSWFNLQ